MLGEIIHNPEVNDQIRAMGISSSSGKEKDEDIDGVADGGHRHHSRVRDGGFHAAAA